MKKPEGLDFKKIKSAGIGCICAAVAVSGALNYSRNTKNEITVTTSGEPLQIVEVIEEVTPVSGIAERVIQETAVQTEHSGKINLNTATAEQLQTVKGIGPSKAEKILQYRKDFGSFSCVEELTEVSGIGEKTLEKLKDSFYVE